jgi:hypothetical protein
MDPEVKLSGETNELLRGAGSFINGLFAAD